MTRNLQTVFLAMLLLSLPVLEASQRNDKALDNFNLSLSDEAREAIDAGVELTFDCEFADPQLLVDISREENSSLQRYTLTRHTLSNRYIVQRGETNTPHIFRSIPEATDYIVAQARLLLESYSSDQKPYSMRISLNKFELPTPMRLKAFIAGSWDLDTGWISWTSAN